MESGCLGRSQVREWQAAPVRRAGFNGVRLFGPESGPTSVNARGRVITASMESGCLGRSQGHVVNTDYAKLAALQWSPAVWAGVSWPGCTRPACPRGFNGVRLFGPESASPTGAACIRRGCFNGVRLFGPESGAGAPGRCPDGLPASMESGCLGRSQSRAWSASKAVWMLQWSPAVWAGVSRSRCGRSVLVPTLQWSPAVWAGVRGPLVGSHNPQSRASMESGCLGRSQVPCRPSRKPDAPLQWSPAVWAGVRVRGVAAGRVHPDRLQWSPAVWAGVSGPDARIEPLRAGIASMESGCLGRSQADRLAVHPP